MHPYIREYCRRLRLLSWNEREQRLRAFLRLNVFIVVYAVVFGFLSVLVTPLGGELFRSALLRVLLACCTIGLVSGAAMYLDKRPVQGYGLEITRRWVSDLIAGLVIGGAIPTVAVGMGMVGGWMTINASGYSLTPSSVRNVGLAIVSISSIAVVEELVFRGYVLTNSLEGLDLRWMSKSTTIAGAWCVSALLFAIAHPAPTLVDGLHFLSAGLLLGFAYLVSGQLGLPIGIHAGFNFVSAFVFSEASDLSITVISISMSGPGWLTGQTGVIQTGLHLPASIAILGYCWWRADERGFSLELLLRGNG